MATRFMYKALPTAALGIALSALLAATPGQGITSTILTGPVALGEIHTMSNSPAHTAVLNTRGASDIYIVHNRIVPGGHTGWHSHPGISFVTIKAGTATFYQADDPNTPLVYPAGTGFVEEADHVHIGRNEGTTDLEIVVLQLVPLGAPRRIDAPAP